MPTPEFILSLRNRIGNDLLWMPGVSGVILDDAGRVLLARRSDNGNWAVVSGIPEPGEQPAAALAREALEETGVVIEVLSVLSVGAGDEIVYPNGDRTRYMDTTFLCRATSGEARVADDESTEVGWFDLDAPPEPLNPSTAPWLGQARAWLTQQAAGHHPQTTFDR